MSPLQVWLAGNSALYTIGCFVAGLVVNNAPAWKIAVAACGIRYLAFLAETIRNDHWRKAVVSSLHPGATACGVVAGLQLLLR